jgi:hypothetical protein
MNQSDTVAALGAVAAGATHGKAAFAVDRHDGDHWVQLAGFLTRRDAKAAIANAVEAGADPEILRVRKLPARA